MANVKTIMLVDDDDSTALLFTASLESAGFAVKWFPRADEAWKYLRANPYPDLVLLDLLLPGELDGLGLLANMKGQPGLKDIPAFIISNTVTTEAAKKARELGATDILVKAETGLQQMTDHVKAYFASHPPQGASPA